MTPTHAIKKGVRYRSSVSRRLITSIEALVRLLTRAHSLARHFARNRSVTLEEAGAAQDMGAPYAARAMRLNYLAPDILVAILNGGDKTH